MCDIVVASWQSNQMMSAQHVSYLKAFNSVHWSKLAFTSSGFIKTTPEGFCLFVFIYFPAFSSKFCLCHKFQKDSLFLTVGLFKFHIILKRQINVSGSIYAYESLLRHASGHLQIQNDLKINLQIVSCLWSSQSLPPLWLLCLRLLWTMNRCGFPCRFFDIPVLKGK